MGKFSRSKGSRGERALVQHLKDLGYTNVHRGLVHEYRKDFRPDVLATYKDREWSFESKSYQDKFKWLYSYLDTQPAPLDENGVLRITDGMGFVAIGRDPTAVDKLGINLPFFNLTGTDGMKGLLNIFKLTALKKEADFLVVKINGKHRIYLRFL